VKQAFADTELNNRMNLTSANSINFARLFPQSFYYFNAVAQLGKFHKPVIFSVPSGNFGNLTAGLIAKKMGLLVHLFIASTNQNHCVPDYLQSGEFNPQLTVHTITNAMDVGNPSNFPRLLELFNKQHQLAVESLSGYWFTDEQTREAMAEIQLEYDYTADPHGAVAYAGLKEYGLGNDFTGIFLETAHPAKFPEEVEKATATPVKIPAELLDILNLEKQSSKIPCSYDCLLEKLDFMK
jgi:threonine synthase